MDNSTIDVFVAARSADRGLRLDRFLQAALVPLSRKQIKRLLDRGQVRLAGRPLRRAGRIIAGDEVFQVAGVPGPPVPDHLTPERVLFVDDHMVVVDKPAGLRMHAVEPGDAQHLVAYLEVLLGLPALHVVSRLDKETSGVVMLARRAEVAATLSEAFARHAVTRIYRALVHGAPAGRDGSVDAPVGPVGHGRFGITRRGRPARTRYQVVAHGQDERGETLSMVVLTPETGRTHQLRVHLSSIGCPIVGDLAHGGRRRPGVFRALLHAESLRWIHPVTRAPMVVASPLPEDLSAAARLVGV